MPFGHIQQRSGAMEVAPALRVAQDFDPLQDFRLERRPEALHLGDAAGMACLFPLAERVDPQLFVKFQHLVRTQSRDREQLENTFRYVLVQRFQRWVCATPMKPLDNPSYCFPHPRNVAEALLRDHLLQRNSEREHTVGGSRISLRSIRIAPLKGGALTNLSA